MEDPGSSHLDEVLWKARDLEIRHDDPESSRRFEYQKLDSSHKIRLIELFPGGAMSVHCQIIVVSLEDSPTYEALSYTWGSLVKTEKLHCQQGYLEITKNLYLALLRLRYKNSRRLLWIDAVCVNQDDLPERGQQVQLMQKIYQQAKQVVVWLGETTDDSDLEEIDVGEDRVWTIAKISGSNLHLPLTWLQHFNRPWFLRIWIIQEVAFARKVVVVHGQQIIPWKDFARISREYIMKRDVNDTLNSPGLQGNLKLAMILPYFIATVHRRFKKKRPVPLLELLDRTAKFQATDLRDKIFALLSVTTVDARRSIIPDYELSMVDVYIGLAKYFVMVSKSLSFLRFALPLHRHENIPSWVPDWSGKIERWGISGQEEYVRDCYEEDEIGHGGMGGNASVDKMSCSNTSLLLKGLNVASIHSINSVWIDKNENEARHEDLVCCLGSWYHSAKSHARFASNRVKRVSAFWGTLQEAYASNVDMEFIETTLKKNLGTRDEDPVSMESSSKNGSLSSSNRSPSQMSKKSSCCELGKANGAGINPVIQDGENINEAGTKEQLENTNSPKVFKINGDDEDSDDDSDDNDYEDDSEDESDSDYDDDEDDDEDGDDDEEDDEDKKDDDEDEDETEDSEDGNMGEDESDSLSYDYSEVIKLDHYRLAPGNSDDDDDLSENGNVPSRETDSSGSPIPGDLDANSDSDGSNEDSDAESHTDSCPAKGAWRVASLFSTRSNSSLSDNSGYPIPDNKSPPHSQPLLFSRKDPTRPKCKLETSHGYSFSNCDCTCTDIDFKHHITPSEEAHHLFNPSSPAMHTPRAKQFLRDNANAICGRVFGFTTQGHMVSLPGDARVTDLVCLFYGLRLPVVIRKVDPGVYELVGGCYVHTEWDWDMFEEEVGLVNMDSFTLV